MVETTSTRANGPASALARRGTRRSPPVARRDAAARRVTSADRRRSLPASGRGVPCRALSTPPGRHLLLSRLRLSIWADLGARRAGLLRNRFQGSVGEQPRLRGSGCTSSTDRYDPETARGPLMNSPGTAGLAWRFVAVRRRGRLVGVPEGLTERVEVSSPTPDAGPPRHSHHSVDAYSRSSNSSFNSS